MAGVRNLLAELAERCRARPARWRRRPIASTPARPTCAGPATPAMRLGSHGHHHVPRCSISPAEFEQELVRSGAVLGGVLGEAPRSLLLPLQQPSARRRGDLRPPLPPGGHRRRRPGHPRHPAPGAAPLHLAGAPRQPAAPPPLALDRNTGLARGDRVWYSFLRCDGLAPGRVRRDHQPHHPGIPAPRLGVLGGVRRHAAGERRRAPARRNGDPAGGLCGRQRPAAGARGDGGGGRRSDPGGQHRLLGGPPGGLGTAAAGADGCWAAPRSRWRPCGSGFLRHAGKSVLLGRFVAVLRVLAGPIAGAVRMPYRRFLLFNMLGAVLWASTMVGLAWLGGRWVPFDQMVKGVVEFGLGALVLLVIVLVVPKLVARFEEAQLEAGGRGSSRLSDAGRRLPTGRSGGRSARAPPGPGRWRGGPRSGPCRGSGSGRGRTPSGWSGSRSG